MSAPNLPDLIEALREVRQRFRCDQVSAAYISPEGKLVELSVSGRLVTIADDDGNLVSLPEGTAS